MERREFHCTTRVSRKFWAISTHGPVHTVMFGRVGAAGRVRTKRFATDEAAQAASEKLIREKLRRGYVEVAPSNGAKPPTAPPAVTSPQVSSLAAIYASRLLPPSPPMPGFVPDADPAELPDVLARPPWLYPRPLEEPSPRMPAEALPESPSLLRRLGRLLGRVAGIVEAPPPPSLGIDRPIAPDPLRRDPARIPPMPAFWEPSAWPRPVLAGRRRALPLAAVEHLGVMLALSTPGRPYAGLAQVRAACDSLSLAAFGWALFRAWIEAGAPLKQGWPMGALVLLGDDEVARRFGRLLLAWPSIGWYQRAVVGLEVLARMEAPASLRELSRIGDKAKSRPLRLRAQGWLKAVAKSQGLTPEILADRLVPDLGLGPDGSRLLEVAGRRLSVGFDHELRPYIKDEAGRRLKDLLVASDAASAESRAAWATMKKEARAVLAEQTRRLERAMCSQRRWDAESFQRLFVKHPLLGRLARRLVWAVFDDEDRVVETFRIAEDGTYADDSDARFAFACGRVGLPHPLELQPRLREAWARLLADYTILQPFPQVARPVHVPVSHELRLVSLDRVSGLKVDHGRLLGLEARGWFKSDVEAGGVIRQFWSPVIGSPFRAELWFEPGLMVLRTKESGVQTLGLLHLWRDGGKPARFGEIGRIAFSEVVEDLESLRG